MFKSSATLIIFIIFLFFTKNIFGQLRDVKWEPWQTMPCYQGISVSVLNMGYGKEAGGYLWGIRIRNDYNIPVRVNYKLTIGEENKISSGFMTSGLLKKGEVWTDGGDVFTANLFKSPSKEYFVALDKVCFDGMKCGGTDECYADCDGVPGKPNQPCGINDNAANKNKKIQPSEIEEWQQENNGQQIKLVKGDNELIETLSNGQSFIFKKIDGDEYKYTSVSGQIEVSIKFINNRTRLIHSFKNLSNSSYNHDDFYNRLSSSSVNKKIFAGKVKSIEGDCIIWQGERDNQKFKLKIAADGIYTAAAAGDFSSTPTWPSAGNGTYVKQNGHSTYTLSFVNEKRYGVSINGNVPDYYNCISDLDNADEWVNVKDNGVVKLAIEDGGVLFNGSGNIIFYPSIGKDTYQTSDRPCNPDCYKTIIRITGKNSFSVDYTNLQGQINRTDDYVRRNK